VVVAVGVRDTGEKSILGVAVGASETEAFWLDFCRRLVGRCEVPRRSELANRIKPC
jgi:transposase-like protein